MRVIRCGKCQAAIPAASLRADAPYICGACGTLLHTEIFPVFFDEVEKGKAPEKAVIDEHARCFNHPDKVAVVSCDECGVFLCDLCDINAADSHLCPKCFKNKKEHIPTFQTKTVLYDEILLSLAVIPMIFLFMTIVTAPAVLVCAVIYRKKLNNTPYTRSKWRYYAAIIIASLQMLGWLAILGAAVWG